MSTRNRSRDKTADKVKQKIEDYQTTIHAIQSFISLVTWDNATEQPIKGFQASMGRKMETSAQNIIAPCITVTPDAVIQRLSTLGYVVEAKKSLPKNDGYWDEEIKQLQKYDDSLTGWWTSDEKIECRCLVLLIEISRSAAFRKYIEQFLETNAVAFQNPFALIEFTRAPEVNEYLFLRRHWGQISDQYVADTLEDGKKVPIERVVASYGEKKFYDSPPPTEYVMTVLWQDVFTERRAGTKFDEGLRAWPIQVAVDELTLEIQKLYGSIGGGNRDVPFPRREWVKEAMEAFVRIGLARRYSKSNNDYTILFKLLRGELLARFATQGKKLGRGERAESSRQLKLFPTSADSGDELNMG